MRRSASVIPRSHAAKGEARTGLRMRLDRRDFIAASAATAIVPACAAAATPVFTPEQFGARGDGVTNDTAAFGRLSGEVNRRSGGTIALAKGRTYLVGKQTRGGRLPGGSGPVAWGPEPLIALRGLDRPLTILGNGARMRAEAGLRFGAFDPQTDEAAHPRMPNYHGDEIATPYEGMIDVRDCRAPVTIRHIELDGNLDRLRIGGKYGDKGWQIPAVGLFLVNNHASEIIENVYSHHHAQDGAIIIGDDARSVRSRFTHYVGRYNGRQGLSITGGRGYDFADCEFSHTGRSALMSPPGAGVDIEAEGKKIVRDLSFTRCKFVDNAGVGLLAEAGNGADARFSDCLFVGTTAWSAWPRKPGFEFDDCTFVGSAVNAYPSKDASLACRFVGCRFTDDPKLSPTGKVYIGKGPIVDLGASENVLFDRCTFRLVDGAALPWSWTATYRDCTMSQRSPTPGETRGRYLGRTTITGRVDLYGSMVQGILIVNGRQIPQGPQGGVKPW
jgi:hypothetical protein